MQCRGMKIVSYHLHDSCIYWIIYFQFTNYGGRDASSCIYIRLHSNEKPGNVEQRSRSSRNWRSFHSLRSIRLQDRHIKEKRVPSSDVCTWQILWKNVLSIYTIHPRTSENICINSICTVADYDDLPLASNCLACSRKQNWELFYITWFSTTRYLPLLFIPKARRIKFLDPNILSSFSWFCTRYLQYSSNTRWMDSETSTFRNKFCVVSTTCEGENVFRKTRPSCEPRVSSVVSNLIVTGRCIHSMQQMKLLAQCGVHRFRSVFHRFQLDSQSVAGDDNLPISELERNSEPLVSLDNLQSSIASFDHLGVFIY